MGLSGSNVNYFVEWMAAASVLVGMAFIRATSFAATSKARHHRIAASAGGIVLPLLLSCQAFVGGGLAGPLGLHWDTIPNVVARESARRVLQIMRTSQGPVLSNELVLVVKADKQVPVTPSVIKDLTTRGVWDQTPILGRVEDGYFDKIVIYGSFIQFTTEFLEVLALHYPFVDVLGPYKAYRQAARS